MKVKIITIDKDENLMLVKTSRNIERIDTSYRYGWVMRNFKVGERIDVERVVNNPFLVPSQSTKHVAEIRHKRRMLGLSETN